MWPNPQETADLVTFLKKSLIENFIFMCSVIGENSPFLANILIQKHIWFPGVFSGYEITVFSRNGFSHALLVLEV